MKLGIWSVILDIKLPVVTSLSIAFMKMLSTIDGFWFLITLVGLLIVGCRLLVSIVSVKFLTCLYKGCYHGTFGNLLPYFTSYMRQVNANIIRNDKAYINIVK